MLRTQGTRIALLLLVALRSSDGFATSSTATSVRQQQRPGFATSQSHEQQGRHSLKRPLPSSTTTTTAAGLFSDASSSTMGVNNRHSSKDYWYNIRTLPSSAILQDIRNPVLSVFGWSTAVAAVHAFCAANSGVSAMAATVASKMCVSSAAHSFLVSALGLLLVFRTNSAYQRFYEGRKIWEQISSVSRNLGRLTQLYGRELGGPRQQRLRNLIAAYPYLLRHHIRSGCLCEGDTVDPDHRLLLEEPSLQMVETRHEGDKRCGGTTSSEVQTQAPPRECFVDKRNLPWSLLTKGALDKVSRSLNRPLWICNRLGREICDIKYGDTSNYSFTNRERQHFLSQVEKLTNAIGQCERIHQTAVPLNYARHSLRSLTIWLFTLPFALVKDLGFMTGPATAVVAWLFFGIYEIGYSIEDPFQGSLRLSNLCDSIRNDVLNIDDDDDTDDYMDDEVESFVSAPASSSSSGSSSSMPSDWIDEDAQDSLKIHILDAAKLASVGASNLTPLPLISLEDYQEIEK